MAPGQEVIDFLYDNMQIDDKWAIRDNASFSWWGWKLRQSVWAEHGHAASGIHTSKITLATDLLFDVPDTDETYRVLSALNGVTSVNAFVFDPADRTVRLLATGYVHRDNEEWMNRFLASVCAIQAADAHARSPLLAGLMDCQPAESAHPERGPRRDMDDMLNVLELFAKIGSQPSRFLSDDFGELERIDPAPWLMANGGGTGFVAEFPYTSEVTAAEASALGRPPGSSLLQAAGGVNNPQLGSGAGFRLQLPIEGEEIRAARLANDLNRAEADEWTGFPLTGAWSGTGPGFEMFLPSGLHQKGLVAAMVFYLGLRAHWVRTKIGKTS